MNPLDKSWTLPEENTEGYIESADEVLSIVNSTNPDPDPDRVELEAKIIPISDEQKWYRGTADKNGWFLLTNPPSGKVLTENKNAYYEYIYIFGNHVLDYHLHIDHKKNSILT